MTPESLPTVYVIDDEPLVCVALSRLIGSAGLSVMTFTSADDFLAAMRPDTPGCVVLDLRMPGMSGLEIQEKLAAAGICLPVIILTGHADIQMTVRAMKAGAIEFLTKPPDEQKLLDAVQVALQQHQIALQKCAEHSTLQARNDSLTPREREVFLLVTDGLLNKQIAAELGTSEKTIKVHRAQVMHKMKATSLAHLVRMAGELRLNSPSSILIRTKVQ